MSRLQDKVVFVSGAARGIGAEAARRMAQNGARVVIGDVLDERGQVMAQRIQSEGGEAIYVHLDVARAEDWAAAMDTTVSRYGGLDVLVNNAAIFLGKSLEEASIEDWERLCSINLTGVVLGTKTALPLLRERGAISPQGSSIINLSSVAGLVGSALDPLYSMTKGGITIFTKAIAVDFGRKGYRVRVNSIHPGAIETDMGSQTLAAQAKTIGTDDPEIARRRYLAAYPIGRLGSAGDIANGVVFLASDESGFMTGSALVIDGGFTAV